MTGLPRATALLIVTALFPSGAGYAQTPVNDMFGDWSRDGQAVLMTSDRGGDPDIYGLRLDGSGWTRLTRAPGRDAHPAWSPDGRHIVFQSPRDGGQTRLYIMDPDGSRQRLLADTEGFCGVAAWSPDGSRLAFQCSSSTSAFGTGAAPWRIFVMGADGAGLRQVSQGPGNDQVPSWSPDGNRIVFYSDRSGGNQLYALSLASGETRQLTSGPAQHWAATYSPDGERIAFMSDADGGKGDVYIADAAFNILQRVTSDGPQFGIPKFSPDGREILYQTSTPSGTRQAVYDIASGRRRILEPRL